MFNIVHVGNRVDISSEGVNFDITPSFISGTSIPIANIEAGGYDWDVTYSGSFIASVKLIKILGAYMRNGYYYDHNDEYARAMTLVSGTSQLIFSESLGYYADAFVASGDYIYFCYFNTDGDFHAVEYSISGDVATDLEVDIYGNIGDAYRPAYSIAYVKGRKIVVSTNVDYPDVYTVDFEFSSVIQDNIDNPLSLKSAVISGDAWVCVLRTITSPQGFRVTYKNFDGISGWTDADIEFTFPASYSISESILVQGKYFCWVVASYRGSSPWEELAQVFCFNVENLLTQQSGWVGDTDFVNHVNNISSVCEGSDGKLYFTTWSFQQTSFPPYESADMWYEYNPAINDLNLIHSQSVTSNVSPPQPRSRAISSSNTVYVWDWNAQAFEKQVGSGGAGTAFLRGKIDNVIGNGNYSCAADDNGQRFAYVIYPTDGTLHIQSMDGSGNQDVSMSGIITVHNIGNYYVAVTYSGSTLNIYIID